MGSGTNPISLRNGRCFICQSVHCANLDELIDQGKKFSFIRDWAIKQKPPLKINQSSFNRHRLKHRFSATVIDIKKGKREESVSETHVKSLTEFLDLVIDKVLSDLRKTGKDSLKPTITEAIKAAEIKAKVNEQSKFEKELVKLFMEVSQGHGYNS